MAQQKRILLGTMRLWVRSPALISGLRIWRSWELWYRSQTRLGSSSVWTTSLGISISHGCSPKKPKKKKFFLRTPRTEHTPDPITCPTSCLQKMPCCPHLQAVPGMHSLCHPPAPHVTWLSCTYPQVSTQTSPFPRSFS